MRSREEMLELRKADVHAAKEGCLAFTQRALNELEFLIAATPTGDLRNVLADAGIHLREAKTAVERVP